MAYAFGYWLAITDMANESSMHVAQAGDQHRPLPPNTHMPDVSGEGIEDE
jgi:hypothetical protein